MFTVIDSICQADFIFQVKHPYYKHKVDMFHDFD